MANTWTVRYLREGAGVGPEDALLALTAFAAGLTASRLVLGGLLRRIRPDRAVFVCIAVALTGGIVLLRTENVAGALVALVLLGAGCAPVFPVVLGYIGERHPLLTGTAFSIALVIALLGNTLLNYVTGTMMAGVGAGIFPIVVTSTMAAVALMFLAARWITTRSAALGVAHTGDNHTDAKEE
jgi:fucose permease